MNAIYPAAGGGVIAKASSNSADVLQPVKAPANAGGTSAAPQASFADIHAGVAAHAVDANGDGIVSADEYVNHIVSAGGTRDQAMAAFRGLDKNGDGVVSDSEFAASVANTRDDDNSKRLALINAELREKLNISELM